MRRSGQRAIFPGRSRRAGAGRGAISAGRRLLLALAVGCMMLRSGGAAAADGQVPPADEVLKTLVPGHPRLIVPASEDQRVRALIQSDATARAYHKQIRSDAEKILNQPTIEHKLIGPRLLQQSRLCAQRIYTLATLHRLEPDPRWVERAVREMEAAAGFPDWNPSHFLDTAEMTHALAIGYDWLYADLTEQQRQTIRRAIVEKGLQPGLRAYGGDRTGWWRNAHHNWNQVCNGGLIIGALAVADEEPEVAGQIIHHALSSLPKAMKSFAPDGGWEEGPGYWDYTMRYTVPLILALESALGRDFGLSESEGLAQTGSFRLDFVGPTGRPFNYADAGDHRNRGSFPMYWLARRFGQPDYLTDGRSDWLGLWLYEKPTTAHPVNQPLARLYRGVDVAFMRSAWGDPNAWWVGFKGGNNKANHSHLDLGTFVIDADGQRWACDLGTDDYNLPGYFGRQRWTYYRLNSHGQNVPLIDGQSQDPAAAAKIIQFGDGSRPFAVADLSRAYGPAVTRLWRGVAMAAGEYVLLQDELESAEPVEYVWQMHTEAAVELAGREATLTLGDRSMRLQVHAPVEAVLSIEPAHGPPPQAQTDRYRKIVLRLPEKVSAAQVVVTLSAQAVAPAVVPLSDWPRQADRE